MDNMEHEAFSPSGLICIGSTGWNVGLDYYARATSLGRELPGGLATDIRTGPLLCVLAFRRF